MKRFLSYWLWIAVAATAFTAIGCEGVIDGMLKPKGVRPGDSSEVPPPINLLLPKTLEVHPFTQTEALGGMVDGIHVRVQARDAYGDPTKAFGDFRFELYHFRQQAHNKKGNLIAKWDVSIDQPTENLTHWDRHTRSYEFKLGWSQKFPTGKRMILVVVFSSRFTPRLTAEREIVAGE